MSRSGLRRWAALPFSKSWEGVPGSRLGRKVLNRIDLCNLIGSWSASLWEIEGSNWQFKNRPVSVDEGHALHGFSPLLGIAICDEKRAMIFVGLASFAQDRSLAKLKITDRV